MQPGCAGLAGEAAEPRGGAQPDLAETYPAERVAMGWNLPNDWLGASPTP